jgi:hypothetical protein
MAEAGQLRLVQPDLPPGADASYVAPRTPDGQPDLQGFWTNATYTPLQRSEDVSAEFYTPEEYFEMLSGRVDREEAQTVPGTTGDVHYDFTQFGLDNSQSTLSLNLRTSLIVDPPNGRLPDRVDGQGGGGRGRNRETQYDQVQNMPIGSRCIIMGGAGPPLMDAGYNSNYQIVQSPGYVTILTEMIHDARIIPLSDGPAAPEELRQWVGLSRGHWEGETLIVETSNFNGGRPFQGAGENRHVTETFTRLSDDHIDYRFTVEDETVWNRNWTASAPLARTVGPIFEFACHETNYGIANILSGARQEEREAAEAEQN